MMLRVILCCSAALLLSPPVLADGTSGKIVAMSGDVWVQPPGASETKASMGASLAPGTKIRTGAKSRAEISFGDGSTLKVRPKSSLQLSATKRHKKKKSSVMLFFGRIWSKVSRTVTGDNHYEVNTPNAVCGVRGTEFETAVADDGSVRVRVDEGSVGVADDDSESVAAEGQEVRGDEEGVDESFTAEEKAKWEAWQKKKAERLRKNGRSIIDKVKGRIMSRKAKLEALRARQKELEGKRKSAEDRARAGDSAAIKEIRAYNDELAVIADAIADLGDATTSQFGLVDHFADLAADPRFRMVDRKYLEAEAASLRRVKATLDKLVAEGTDISMEAMDDLLQDMSEGKRGTLFDGKGSAGDDLFGPDDDMNFDMK